jgi:peroxiredoxin
MSSPPHVFSKKNIYIWIAVTLLIAAAILMIANAENWFSFKKNQLPTLSIQDVYGRQITSADLQNKPVIIEFWATSCVTCIREMPSMIQLHRDFSDKGLRIISIAMQYDKPSNVLEFTQHNQLPMSVVYDHSGQLAKTIPQSLGLSQIYGTPTVFLIDPQGELSQQYVGNVNFNQIRKNLAQWLNPN